MIKKIKILSITAVTFFFSSCNQPVRNQKLISNDTKLNREIQVKMDSIQPVRNQKLISNDIKLNREIQVKTDSIIIKYWNIYEANEYRFHYIKGLLYINSQYFGFKKKIKDEHIKNNFLNYVDIFYISKKPIILSEKNEPSPVSDYATITVIGYIGEKKAFEKSTTLYSNLEFNPKFLEFYEFLDKLVKQK